MAELNETVLYSYDKAGEIPDLIDELVSQAVIKINQGRINKSAKLYLIFMPEEPTHPTKEKRKGIMGWTTEKRKLDSTNSKTLFIKKQFETKLKRAIN